MAAQVTTVAQQKGGAGKTVAIVDIDLHAYTEARFAVWTADLVIIPMQPSPMDT